jgi:hypothetical protein
MKATSAIIVGSGSCRSIHNRIQVEIHFAQALIGYNDRDLKNSNDQGQEIATVQGCLAHFGSFLTLATS